MKKTGLFKIIIFTILGILLLTWLVPANNFENGSLASYGMYRIGFFDFWSLLFGTFQYEYFFPMLILLVSIGALYGVLVKTGKYRAWIDRIASNLKGSGLSVLFLIIIAFIFAALTSAFSYGLLLFIFIPAIISIILAMGYDKVTAALTTFGAMFVGTIGSTIGYNINGVVNEKLSATLVDGLWFKLGLFVFAFGALVAFILVKSKTVSKEETAKLVGEDTFVGEKNANKISVAPIIVIFSILFVLLILGCTPWESTFNLKIFTTFNEKVAAIKIKDFAIFGSLLGSVQAFGDWYYIEMSIVCLLSALLVGRLYRMKHSEILKHMADGAKKMLAPAMLVMLTYAVLFFAGNTMVFPTIADFLLKATSKFNIFFSSLVMILGSALHVDFLYVANYVIPQLAAQDVGKDVVLVLSQGLYGVTMFVAPTSAMLVLGLSYLNIPFKEWIKKTWMLVVALLIIVIIATVLAILI